MESSAYHMESSAYHLKSSACHMESSAYHMESSACHMESSNAGSGMSWTAPAAVTHRSSQKSQPAQVRRASHMEKSSSIPTESDNTTAGEQSVRDL
jgi:hypothetical protein